MTELRFLGDWVFAWAFDAADSGRACEGSLWADVRLALFSDRVYNQVGFWVYSIPPERMDCVWPNRGMFFSNGFRRQLTG